MNDKKISRYFASAALLIFFLLVGFGITGSSLGWLKNYPGVCDIMELTGERKLAGVYRGIRCDEFLHQATPNALAQYYAIPRFPRYNPNAGGSLMDMTVLHDTGAPVWHISTLAKPAVWGFFFLDLRRALSWYWWFPVFIGFFGIWFLLNELFPEQRFLHCILSLSLTFSPVCAAWSFWPLYNAGGLCIATVLFLKLLKMENTWSCLLTGLLMSWAVLTSLMSLYFPRIYPILWLLVFIVMAYMTENKLWGQLKKRYILDAVVLAILLCIAFVLFWIYDAYPAIATLAGTDYPGQRRITGGTMGFWTIVKGWLSPLTVYKVEYSNQCELQGPLALWFPLMILGWHYFKKNRQDFLGWTLLFVILWNYVYQIAGFPQWLCILSFWNRCNPPRCDFVLALAQIIFFALLVKRVPGLQIQHPFLKSLLVLIPLILLLVIAPLDLYAGLLQVYPAWYILIVIIVILFFCWLCGFLLLKRNKAFAWIFCAVSILPGIVFNPVCIAPVRIENKLAKIVHTQNDLKYNGRFLFLDEKNFPAVAGWLTGAKVMNGYYLYPDLRVTRQLFKDRPDGFSYNRIANYDVIPCAWETPLKSFEGTGSDHIRILVSAPCFDFSQWEIDFVTALKKYRMHLKKNPSLRWIQSGRELDFYRVVIP